MLIVTFILPIPDLANAIVKPILDQLVKLADMGIISPDTPIETLKNIVIYGNYLSIASLTFIIIIFVSMMSGIAWMFIDKRAISVTFRNDEPPKKFRRIIKESDDYFYFQSLENFRQWLAIPKTEVSRIKNISITEGSIFNKFIIDHCSHFFERHSTLNYWIGDENRRRYIIIGLLVVVLVITLIPRYNEYILLRIGFIVVLVPMIILLLIHTAFEEKTEDDI